MNKGKQNGFVLIGLLIAVMIIAALVYGSSFISRDENKVNIIDIDNKMKDLEKNFEQYNSAVQEQLKSTTTNLKN